MSPCSSPRFRQDCRKNSTVRLGEQSPFNVNGWMKGRTDGWMTGQMDEKIHFVHDVLYICKLNTLQKHINKSSNKLESILLGLFSCTSVALLDTLLAVPTSWNPNHHQLCIVQGIRWLYAKKHFKFQTTQCLLQCNQPPKFSKVESWDINSQENQQCAKSGSWLYKPTILAYKSRQKSILPIMRNISVVESLEFKMYCYKSSTPYFCLLQHLWI